jgi:predicted Holliday junction resolvase-like endonuclease
MWLVLVGALLGIALLLIRRQAIKNREFQREFAARLGSEVEKFRREELLRERDLIIKEQKLHFEAYKNDWEAAIRKDAVNRSSAILSGKYIENFLPFMEEFNLNPRDTRFIGNPIDLICFEGASEEETVVIHFIEVKTGTSRLNDKQKLIRDAVINKRVRWVEMRV